MLHIRLYSTFSAEYTETGYGHCSVEELHMYLEVYMYIVRGCDRVMRPCTITLWLYIPLSVGVHAFIIPPV